MPKTRITNEQLEQIIRLKQKNYSWLRMQKEFGIPRRSAKNAYDKWVKNKTVEELKGARLEVATLEFQKHISDLISVAETFIEHLPKSIFIGEARDADTVINDIWRKNLSEMDEEKKPRIIRRNKLLFESLQEHTREKLQWESLQNWKDRWNTGIKLTSDIKRDIDDILSNILDQKENESINRLVMLSKNKKLYEDMINGIFEAVWRGILDNKPEEGFNSIRIKQESTDTSSIIFGYPGSIGKINVDIKNADLLKSVCSQAAQIICRKQMVLQTANTLKHIKEDVNNLDLLLDSIKLKPLIIRTRCELCPA